MFRAPLCPSSGAQGLILLSLSFPRLQPAHQMLKTICSDIRPRAPEDGQNGGRNMLNWWLIHKSYFLHQVGLTNHFRDSMLSKQAIECSEVWILSVPLQCQDCNLSERCNLQFQCGVIFYFSLILTNPFYALPVRERCLLKTKMDKITFGRLEWRIFEDKMSISIVKPSRYTNVTNSFYFEMTLYMFRTVFPSIIRSSRLYIQPQAFVKQIMLSAC